MKSILNRIFVILAALFILMILIVMDSNAQEGYVCVGFETADSELILLNLNTMEEMVLETHTFDFTVDPITGDLYLARMLQIGSYQIELNSEVLYESGNRFYGFDAYNGQLVFTDASFNALGASDIRTYLYENGELSLLEIEGGWPALGKNGLITHLDQTSWFNNVENPNIRGNYPMSFNPQGTQLLSIEHFELWLYDFESNEPHELLSELGEDTFVVSADWLPDGDILVSTYDTETGNGSLWSYNEQGGRLTPLYSREDTSLGHAQVIPCDYALEQ